jgi:hypothetical protein
MTLHTAHKANLSSAVPELPPFPAEGSRNSSPGIINSLLSTVRLPTIRWQTPLSQGIQPADPELSPGTISTPKHSATDPASQPVLSFSQLMGYAGLCSKPAAYFAWPLSYHLGVAGLLGMGAYEAYSNPDRAQGIAGGTGLIAGGVLGANMLGSYGAYLGGTLGSAFPGLGTVLGSFIGGSLGTITGAVCGSKFGLALGHEIVTVNRKLQRDTDERVLKIDHWLKNDAPAWLRWFVR